MIKLFQKFSFVSKTINVYMLLFFIFCQVLFFELSIEYLFRGYKCKNEYFRLNATIMSWLAFAVPKNTSFVRSGQHYSEGNRVGYRGNPRSSRGMLRALLTYHMTGGEGKSDWQRRYNGERLLGHYAALHNSLYVLSTTLMLHGKR